MPPTETATRFRRSRHTFLCRGKNHPRLSTPPPAVPTARDWEYNHAHFAPHRNDVGPLNLGHLCLH